MHKEHKKYLNSGFDHCITLHWVWFLGEFDCDISHYWWILVSMMWNGKELPLSCGSQIQNTYTVLYLGTVVSTADCQGECLYRQADKGSHCWTPLGHLLQTMRLQLQYQYCQCAVGGIGKEGRNVVLREELRRRWIQWQKLALAFLKLFSKIPSHFTWKWQQNGENSSNKITGTIYCGCRLLPLPLWAVCSCQNWLVQL